MHAADVAAKDMAANAAAVDRLVLATVNAPYKRDIDVATLLRCIAEAKLDGWPVHVATFFTDLTPHLVLGFAGNHGISEAKLAEAYRAMKAETGEQNLDLEAELVPLAPSSR